MNRFKPKRNSNNLIFYFGIFIISIAFTIKYLYKEDLINEDTLVDILISDNLGSYKKNITNVDFVVKYLLDVELNKTESVIKENDKTGETLVVEENLTPIVYIYNTHQEEKYQSAYLGEYNIASSVFLASKILKEYLEDLGIGVIVEEENVTSKLKSLGWKYGSSYKVSRMFMEDAFKEHSTLKYFIDVHRDSSDYSKTTVDINGEKYAKLLFVVGLDNENYTGNLKLAENLKEKLKLEEPTLVRGVLKKSGKGVNGIYNQDFNSNTMLIEVGGQYNNINEVNNTLKVFAKVLSKYIKEDIYD